MLGQFVIYSNSPSGVRRVIDAHQGQRKRMADAGDFRYLRTVFPWGQGREDGFVFLSDAFIRRLAGPASRLRSVLDPLFMLPLSTSAVTLGFGFIIALDKSPLNLRTSYGLKPTSGITFFGVTVISTAAVRSLLRTSC